MDIEALLKSTKALKVLYVEDNLGAREQTTSMLKNFFDDIVVAEDGLEGLDAFNKNKNFDIIISDINMPKMGGIEMIQKIREVNDSICVFLLSAYKESDCLTKNEQGKIDGYIPKPIDIDQFVELLANTVKIL